MRYYKGAYQLFSNHFDEIDDFPDERTEDMPVIVAAESLALADRRITSDGFPKTESWVNTMAWPNLTEITLKEFEEMRKRPDMMVKE